MLPVGRVPSQPHQFPSLPFAFFASVGSGLSPCSGAAPHGFAAPEKSPSHGIANKPIAMLLLISLS